MKYFSLFSGIGGFDHALNQLGHKAVGYSEIDKYAIQIYNSNFKGTKNYGDATKITTLPDFDILVGGFPCQAFSIAGKREGFNDTRGTLFFEVARILKSKRPRFVLIENVKGLVNHKKGETFTIILETLWKLGYTSQWGVLNCRYFGIPQNRERVFLIGTLRTEPRYEIFPIRNTATKIQKLYQRKTAVRCLDANMFKGITPEYYFNKSRRNVIVVTNERKEFREHTTIEEVPTLKNRMGTGGNNVPSLLTKSNKGKLRKLTPLECERLMGFPDNWTKGVSDTQRYKMLGNSVVPVIVNEICKKLERKASV